MTIDSVLIANRGEIAVRICDTLRRLGITSVAVYSEPDARSAHVAAADVAVSLGPDPRSYLDIDAVMAAAKACGVSAIHPGYGFLSENAAFAQACADANIIFIGPSPQVIESMGSKIAAKEIAQRAGVPVVPGRFEPGLTDEQIMAAVAEVGVPVLLKASAGGGGKGMRIVTDVADVPAAIDAAKREAAAAFGDDALMVERFLESPRHIEVQVLGDQQGNVVALADRECSLQRRHQKVIEEAPVTSIPDEVRAQMAKDAISLASSVGYVGAGTVEFIVSGTDSSEYYFLEMNTRLQVEHPVTELVTGLDLVAWQVAVAQGATVAELAVRPQQVAVEARIYAEDPTANFLPTGGELLLVDFPDRRVRVDAGVRTGDTVSSYYDPMLAKVIATGADRVSAYRALHAALTDSTVLGVTTNLGYLIGLTADPAVLTNSVHTRWIDEQEVKAPEIPRLGLIAAAADRWLPIDADPVDLWAQRTGWRLGEPGWAGWRYRNRDGVFDVEVRSSGGQLESRVTRPDEEGTDGELLQVHRQDSRIVLVTGSQTQVFTVLHDRFGVWVGHRGQAWYLTEVPRLAADRADEGVAGLDPVRSPMPGTVIEIASQAGDQVTAGDPLLTVEAMKMEHTLRASADGTVAAVLVAVGDRVTLDQDLISWEAADA